MNITGLSQYSKAVSGMRRPSEFTGQDLNLLFIYPILFADKLQDLKNIQTIIRTFLSVDFLKQIFVQNAISVVSMANQIQPLSDEEGKQVNPAEIIAKSLGTMSGQTSYDRTSTTPPIYNISSGYRHEIQQKINQKIAVINQYTKTDPVLSTLNPYIEMITMGNLIEVPVIVGTKPLTVDTLTLTHILIAAISLRRPLTSKQNLDEICTVLENLNPTRYWRMLENLTEPLNPSNDVSSWFRKMWIKSGRAVGHISTTAGQIIGNIGAPKRVQRIDSSNIRTPNFNEDETFFVLRTIKSNLNQTRLFFNFVLDQNLLRTQFNIHIQDEASSRVDVIQKVLTPELNKIVKITMSQFIDYLTSQGIVALRSAITSVAPSPEPIAVNRGDTYDILTGLRQNQHTTVIQLEESLGRIVNLVKSSFEGSATGRSLEKISIARKISNVGLIETLSNISKKVNDNILLADFNLDQFMRFNDALADAGEKGFAQSYKLEKLLDELIEDETLDNHFRNLYLTIAEFVKKIFNPIEQSYNIPGTLPIIVKMAHNQNPPVPMPVNQVTNNIIPSYIKYLSKYFYFLLLTAFQDSFQKLFLVADFNLEMSKNEVTEWPNYSLVLPFEIVSMLHVALTTKNWKELTTDYTTGERLTSAQLGQRGVISLNDNYVKNIVKLVSMKLGIPNLFVIDSKKGDVYYKLMYSSSINKTKLSTFETFVKSALNKPVTQNQSQYSY